MFFVVFFFVGIGLYLIGRAVTGLGRLEAEVKSQIEPELKRQVATLDILNADCLRDFFKDLGQYLDAIEDGEVVTGESVKRKIVELSAKNFNRGE